jgi:hypothetical protein
MQRILTGLTVLAVLLPSALNAQATCATRATLIEKLETGYGEAFAGGGLQNSTSIFEVWFSEEKGTWTILMTRADGTSCIMASGTNWREALPSQKIAKGTPS